LLLSSFASIACAFGVTSRHHCWDPCHGIFPLFKGDLWIRALCMSLVHFELISM
jgi:hypothetical protein